MIERELFKKYVKAYCDYSDFGDKFYDLTKASLFEVPGFNELENSYIDILSMLCGTYNEGFDEVEEYLMLYVTGDLPLEFSITEDGVEKNYSIQTIDELYDYLVEIGK